MSRRPRLPIPRRRIVLPGPSRLFLYAETALLLILGISLLSSYLKQYPPSSQTGGSFYQIADIPQGTNHGETSHNQEEAGPPDGARQSESESQPQQSKKFIKWVDFTVTSEAMTKAFRLDVDTIQQEPHLNWIQLLAYLGARYGGDFSRYKAADMDALVQKLKSGQTMEELTEEMKYYNYYLEAYSAVLGGMVGTFEEEIPMDQVPDSVSCRPAEPAEGSSQPQTVWVTRYGLKAFPPSPRASPTPSSTISAQPEATALSGSIWGMI